VAAVCQSSSFEVRGVIPRKTEAAPRFAVKLRDADEPLAEIPQTFRQHPRCRFVDGRSRGTLGQRAQRFAQTVKGVATRLPAEHRVTRVYGDSYSD